MARPLVKAPVQLHLQAVVHGGVAGEVERGIGGALELLIQRTAVHAFAHLVGGIGHVQVVGGGGAHAVVAHVGHVQREVQRKRTLDGEVPRLHVGVLIVQRNHDVALRQGRVGDDPVGGNHGQLGSREAARHGEHATRGDAGRVGVGAEGVLVVLLHREVVRVGVVRERRVADAEAGADHRGIVHAVGDSEARRKVFPVLLHTHIHGVAADAGEDQRVVRRVVVGEAAGERRCGRRVELPAEAEIERQFGRYLPLVLHEGEELVAAQGREVGRDVASAVGRLIQQEAGHIVDQSGLGLPRRRSRD